ncbi:hypothetical protein HN018_10580 [Lichenicola cladoniae]|jgi:hypothetical protein|uniref:Uncharacterized protein n=1 Tax=Lichenicola cladoniae TaxID=1484109 RepID=A0A6M8HQ59_9PROT|nr:hypothetical protein [Lichenicola cladoniae]NPD69718.1 hypothetical protein [Acetobacteraceae bacterium]QKE90420.1 hypothetical protein HN018_10580 [Lichenicola cladoniae]
MNDVPTRIGGANRLALSNTQRFKRNMAIIVARGASRSWLVLAAMPVAVVVCALVYA